MMAIRPLVRHVPLVVTTAFVCLAAAGATRAEPAAATPHEGPTAARQAGAQENQSDGGTAAVGAATAFARRPLTPEEAAEIGPGGKRLTATATPAAPVLDGLVDDDVWELAEVITDFLQREPVEAGTPSQRTEARILFDDENLYVAFVMHDDPARISATDMRRDSRLEADDTIAIILDTYHDHRNGFLFRVNPLGTKYDATVKDENDINSQWDERWEAAARITSRGWEAELMIPFKALRYPIDAHVWGVDFKREIRRTNEEINWSNYRQGFDFRKVSQSGHMVGLGTLRLADRFRLKPYVSGGYTLLNASDAPLSTGDGNFGVEVFKYQLTPNLTADLTVNTDFAQVEDDQERVNLTRFPLFFAERREFFLEGADTFAFGSGGEMGGPSLRLFHSRNIGLIDGAPVPMRYGAKLTGKIGNTTVGFINAGTGAEPEVAYEGRNYSVLRVKQDILQRSSIGVMFTNAMGGGDGATNRVGGIDAQFRFFDYLSIGGYVAQAHDSATDGARYVGSLGASWDSDLWRFSAEMDYVDEDFQTDLGFVRRTDMFRRELSVGWKPRPRWGWMRRIMNFATVEYITDTDGSLQSRRQSLWTRWQLESGDSFNVSLSRNFERLETGFSPSESAEILPGDYAYSTWRVSLDSYRARRLSGRFNVSGGGFFDGTRTSYGGGVTWRVNEKASLSPGYSFNRVALPGDSFDTHVGTMRASYNFSERFLTSALVQYNSVADRLSVFARLNYIHRTGDDFFLVYKSTVRYDPEFYGQVDQAILAKVTRSFDF